MHSFFYEKDKSRTWDLWAKKKIRQSMTGTLKSLLYWGEGGGRNLKQSSNIPFFPLTSYDVNWCKPHCTRQKCICGTASRRMHRRGGLGGSSNRRGRLRTLIYNPMSTTKLTTTSSCYTTALVYGLKYLFL